LKVPRGSGRTLDRRGLGLSILGLSVSAIAVWLCVRSIDVSEVAHQLGHADAGPLAVFLMVLAFQTVVRATRWSLLLPLCGSRRITTRRTLPPLLVGYLGNATLPARLGEPARAVLLARREGLPAAAAFGSVVLERAIDTATLALVVLPAAWMAGAPRWIIDLAAVAAIAGGILLSVLSLVGLAGPSRAVDRLSGRFGSGAAASIATRLAGPFREFATGIGASNRRPVVLLAALLSLLAWGMDATLIWLAATSIGVTLGPAQAVMIAGVAVFATVIPAAPGYVGTYELAATATAVALGVNAESALAVAVLAHAMTLLPLAGGGTVALLTIQRAGPGGAEVAPAATADGDPSLPLRKGV
jgi:uncharacterized protein (TIRG00374 family)